MDFFSFEKPATCSECERAAKLRFPGGGNGKSPEFGILRDRACEKFVYRRLKQLYPTVEILRFERVFSVQFHVFLNGVAVVQINFFQQQKFPEIVHNRQVVLPIYICYIIENVPDNIVLPHFRIESVNEQFDIGRCGNVRFVLFVHRSWLLVIDF